MKLEIQEVPRPNIKRLERTGECFMSGQKSHYYLVRKNDVLHVNTDGVINTLYDNYITNDRITNDKEFIKISRSEFNEVLNRVVFDLDYFGKEYSV